MRKDKIPEIKNVQYRLANSTRPGYVSCAIFYELSGKSKNLVIYIPVNPKWKNKDYLEYAKEYFAKNVAGEQQKGRNPLVAPLIITSCLSFVAILALSILGGLGYIGGRPIHHNYTIKFVDAESLEELSATQTVEYNHLVQRPNVPIKEGYSFKNWYTTPECDHEFNFNDKLTDLSINDPITAYGKFEINTYTVFYVDKTPGCTLDKYADKNVLYNSTIKDAPIVKDEHDEPVSDVTWWDDETIIGGKQFIFGEGGTPVTNNITLYAQHGVIPEPGEFESDSWYVFLTEIQGKSFAELHKEGAIYADDWRDDERGYLGKVRTVDIGQSRPLKAIVVDEDREAKANEAKFTFMLCAEQVEEGEKIAYGRDSLYEFSNVRRKAESIRASLPAILKDNIKTPEQLCYDPSIPIENDPMYTINDGFCAPSYSQLTGQAINPGDPEGEIKEGDQFAAFANKTVLAEIAGKLGCFWLRTPGLAQAHNAYSYDCTGTGDPQTLLETIYDPDHPEVTPPEHSVCLIFSV
ncbi:MAG: InlB B-repeat-containing protein [Bacilli bacterium]|nr:InlB B-repeat-containing protein [Bacilli bacterium]